GRTGLARVTFSTRSEKLRIATISVVGLPWASALWTWCGNSRPKPLETSCRLPPDLEPLPPPPPPPPQEATARSAIRGKSARLLARVVEFKFARIAMTLGGIRAVGTAAKPPGRVCRARQCSGL